MNLVQINERLKDMPIQAVQQYANGMNPDIPPYLALGELQRREASHKQAATAQGAAQGPAPSVKEQIEQKAGLMALQQAQLQQQQQQQMQPQPGGPAPAGIPQPQMQPQAAPQTGMAMGGLTGLPVRQGMYDFAGGGIVAFADGGSTISKYGTEQPLSEEEKARLKRELMMRIIGEEKRNPPERRAPMEMTEQDLTSIPGMEGGDSFARAMAGARGEQPAPAPQGPDMSSQIPGGGPAGWTGGQGERVQGSELTRNIQNTMAAMPGAGAMRATTPARSAVANVAGLAGLLGNYKGQTPERAAPAAAPSASAPTPTPQDFRRAPFQDPRLLTGREGQGLAALSQSESGTGPSPMGNVPTARPGMPPSAGPSAAPGSAPRPAAPATPGAAPAGDMGIPGLNDPSIMAAAKRAMAEPNQDQTISEYQARMAKMAPGQYGSEQEQRLQKMRDMYAKGTESRGLERLMQVLGGRSLGEYGDRYLGAVQGERASDLAHESRMNELQAAIEAKRREEAMGGVKTVGEELARARQTGAQAATSLAGSQMQAGVSRANQLSSSDTQLKIASMDRALRERLHNTPAAQSPTVEQQAVKDYIAAGLSPTAAYEKVKQIASGFKGEMTRDQAADNVRKNMENMMLAGEMRKAAATALKAQGNANPSITDIMNYLVDQELKGSARPGAAAPASSLPKGVTVSKIG